MPAEETSVVKLYYDYVFGTLSEKASASAQLSAPSKYAIQFTLSTSLFGFVSGFYLKSQERSVQFLAENAHRLPKRKGGWYFYHQAKNRERMAAGMKGGIRQMGVFGGISVLFCSIENQVESWWGREGLVSCLSAGVLSSVVFVGASQLGRGRYGRSFAKRTLLVGAGVGGMMGMVHEMNSVLFGTSLKYMTLSEPLDSNTH